MRSLSSRLFANSLLLGGALFAVQLPVTGPARAVPERDATPAPIAPHAPTGVGEEQGHPVQPAQPGEVSRVYFDDGHASTVPRSVRTLRSIQLMMAQHPEVLVLRIEGHADDLGDPTFNLEISKRRVRGVARWLIENGVPAERLKLLACGRRYAEPGVRTNTVRAQNRRVELSTGDSPGGATHEQCDPIEPK